MKNLMNLGKVLSKNEQKTINGGSPVDKCRSNSNCTSSYNITGICARGTCVYVE